jgi:predicted DNA-binding protein YlxM (UPF0122 family)
VPQHSLVTSELSCLLSIYLFLISNKQFALVSNGKLVCIFHDELGMAESIAKAGLVSVSQQLYKRIKEAQPALIKKQLTASMISTTFLVLLLHT